MRSLKFVGVLAGIALAGAWVGAGCANSSDTGDFGEPPPDAAGDGAAVNPSDAAQADTGVHDATLQDMGQGQLDAGDASVGVDVGVDAPPVVMGEAGSPCSPLNATESQICGVCGTQTSTCTGSPPVWGPWGACAGELAGGCTPGTMTTQSCGLCGTQTILCENDCQLAESSCTGQVTGGCISGSIDFEYIPSCSDGGASGETRSCSNACAWGSFSACEAPPTTLTVPTSLGATVDTIINFAATQTIDSLADFSSGFSSDCPIPDPPSTPKRPYAYVLVSNATAQTATLSAWTSQPASAPVIDTLITSYSGATPPSNNTEREDCTQGVMGFFGNGVYTDTCGDMSDSTSCMTNYGGLMIGDGQALLIPPNSSFELYLESVNNDTGPVRVVIRTESLQ